MIYLYVAMTNKLYKYNSAENMTFYIVNQYEYV